MKTITSLLIATLVLTVTSCCNAQCFYGANGFTPVQLPYGGVVMAPRAGIPMYPVASPALNNFYGGGWGGGYCQPMVIQQPAFFGGFGGYGGFQGGFGGGYRAYGGTWNNFGRCR